MPSIQKSLTEARESVYASETMRHAIPQQAIDSN